MMNHMDLQDTVKDSSPDSTDFPLTFLQAVEAILKGKAVVRRSPEAGMLNLIIQKEKGSGAWHSALFDSEDDSLEEITMFTHIIDKDDEQAAWRLASRKESDRLFFD